MHSFGGGDWGRFPALILGLAMFAILLPAAAGASGIVQNYMEADAVAAVGPQFFDYQLGSQYTFDVGAEFTTGTFSNTAVDSTANWVELSGTGTVPAGWWDTDWGARRCFKVDNPGAALTEHQVRLEIDTVADVAGGFVQANGEDYRAIASDGTTQLDLWVEGPMNDVATVVWVQLDIPAGGEKFCLYHDNSTAASVSSEADVFSYSVPRQLYFPANWRYNGTGNVDGRVDIVSFVNNNTVSVDGVTQVLNAGQSHTFKKVTPDSVVLVTGPIAGRGQGDGTDALVPISFAGVEIVVPTNRYVQRFTMIAPYGGTATVEIYNGTALSWTGNVGGTTNSPTVDISNNRSARIVSTNGVPILVTHASTVGHDVATVPPFFPGDDIYGVRSRTTNIGVFQGPASLDIYRSDGTSQSLVGLATGSETSLYDAADLDGNGTAVRLTNMSDFVGGFQQADRDGNESTAFLPERLLDSEYYLPSAADYVTFACPVTMTIMVGATAVPCNSPAIGYPGHGWIGATPANTRISSASGEPFYAYYESTLYDNETNLFGMKSAQTTTATPLTLTAATQQFLPSGPTSGTWTSPVLDTLATGTNVFGLISPSTTVPTGTTLGIQVASGPTAATAAAAPFLGPDGTAATFYTADAPLPYGLDFTDQFVVLRASFSTTTSGISPRLDMVSFGYDLPEIDTNPSNHSVVTMGATLDTDWVARVWVTDPAFTGATAIVAHRSSTGLTGASGARLRTDTTAQVYITGGVVTQVSGPAFPIGPTQPHSIIIDTESMAGATVVVAWEATISGTGILVHHPLQLNFS